MCFRFGSCFGSGGHKDDYGPRPSTPGRGADHGRSGYHGNGHKAAAAGPFDEAGRKCYYDAPRDGHGHGYAYPAADEALKLAARNNNKVGDHAGYEARLHEAAADRESAMDYHNATTTATVERY